MRCRMWTGIQGLSRCFPPWNQIQISTLESNLNLHLWIKFKSLKIATQWSLKIATSQMVSQNCYITSGLSKLLHHKWSLQIATSPSMQLEATHAMYATLATSKHNNYQDKVHRHPTTSLSTSLSTIPIGRRRCPHWESARSRARKPRPEKQPAGEESLQLFNFTSPDGFQMEISPGQFCQTSDCHRWTCCPPPSTSAWTSPSYSCKQLGNSIGEYLKSEWETWSDLRHFASPRRCRQWGGRRRCTGDSRCSPGTVRAIKQMVRAIKRGKDAVVNIQVALFSFYTGCVKIHLHPCHHLVIIDTIR